MKKTPIKKKKTVSQAKKATWTIFSIWVRMRDCLRTTGCTSWGLCFTCDKRYHIKLLQAGHFVPGRHNANLFNPAGCHAQCYYCNITLKGNTLEYRRRINKLYGEGTDVIIEETARQIKKFTVEELVELGRYYKENIKVLEE